MAEFWLGFCGIEMPDTPPVPPTAQPLLFANGRPLVLEVIHDNQQYAVLFSAMNPEDDAGGAGCLECLIGFVSSAKACSLWGDRGFPLVDATITANDKTLTIVTPFFDAPGPMRYQDTLMKISGLDFAKGKASADDLPSEYRQFQNAPDDGLPATYVERRRVIWKPQRTSIHDWGPQQLDIFVAASRWPGLNPLGSGLLQFTRVVTGTFGFALPPRYPDVITKPVNRMAMFGAPAFRFEDVEVLGFRADLAALGADMGKGLAQLVAPLNFHLKPGALATERKGEMPSDFEYRAATATLVIELLRYGKMRQSSPIAPLTGADYQSQHELVVRVLVGRVDDDTAQAHSPAIYVPAVFVDNPWSKIVGRDLQGFDKWMAAFCARGKTGGLACLLPDGFMPTDAGTEPSLTPQELADITEIKLLNLPDSRTGGTPLLELDCSPDRFANWDDFQSIDLELAMGSSSLAGVRWRQPDFDQTEFRRSFARAASFRRLRGFRSIQVSPVGKRKLAQTWITGTFRVDDELSIVRPGGVAGLTFCYSRESPKGWQALCALMNIPKVENASRTVSFPTGSWYRLRCSMDLLTDNGLEWGDTPSAA